MPATAAPVASFNRERFGVKDVETGIEDMRKLALQLVDMNVETIDFEPEPDASWPATFAQHRGRLLKFTRRKH